MLAATHSSKNLLRRLFHYLFSFKPNSFKHNPPAKVGKFDTFVSNGSTYIIEEGADIRGDEQHVGERFHVNQNTSAKSLRNSAAAHVEAWKERLSEPEIKEAFVLRVYAATVSARSSPTCQRSHGGESDLSVTDGGAQVADMCHSRARIHHPAGAEASHRG